LSRRPAAPDAFRWDPVANRTFLVWVVIAKKHKLGCAGASLFFHRCRYFVCLSIRHRVYHRSLPQFGGFSTCRKHVCPELCRSWLSSVCASHVRPTRCCMGNQLIGISMYSFGSCTDHLLLLWSTCSSDVKIHGKAVKSAGLLAMHRMWHRPNLVISYSSIYQPQKYITTTYTVHGKSDTASSPQPPHLTHLKCLLLTRHGSMPRDPDCAPNRPQRNRGV
jgi:hypothetical protein